MATRLWHPASRLFKLHGGRVCEFLTIRRGGGGREGGKEDESRNSSLDRWIRKIARLETGVGEGEREKGGGSMC